MLAAIGAPDTEALFDEIPARLRAKSLDEVPPALSEMEVGRLMSARAAVRRAAAQLHRRRRVRPPRAGGGVADRHARRVLQRLHALPGRGQPGHAAAAVRIPVDDGEPDGHGGLERLAVRRRHRACGGLPDGGAHAPQVEVAADPGAGRAEPDLPPGAAVGRGQPEPRVRAAALRPERRPHHGREPREVPRRGHHGARDPAAEFLRHARGRGRAHRPRPRGGHAGHRGGQPDLARDPEAAGRVGRQGRRHRLRRGAAARRAAVVRRPVLRLHDHAHGARAPDAGAHRRAHRGPRRAARLHAHAAGARAAHPPQQGDLEHLHQPGPAGHRGHHLHGAARPARPRPGRLDLHGPLGRARRGAHAGARRAPRLRPAAIPRGGAAARPPRARRARGARGARHRGRLRRLARSTHPSATRCSSARRRPARPRTSRPMRARSPT